MMTLFLVPISWLYGGGMWLRNWCYRHGVFRVATCPVPVISVGNLTAGGTGKTPFTESLVRLLMGAGKRVAVVSRGYKRKSAGTVVVSDGRSLLADARSAGDEAYQTATRFPSIVVIVDEIRRRAAAMAATEYSADVVLMDDGFQHQGLRRDLDIVMIGGDRSPEKIPLLPAGMRREPMGGLRRADIIVVPDGSKVTDGDIRRFSDAPVLRARKVPVKFVSIFGRGEMAPDSIAGKKCAAVCGIGDPESFREMLLRLGARLEDAVTFDDHHDFTDRDLAHVQETLGRTSTQTLITTEKDAVKIRSLKLPDAWDTSEWYFLEIAMEVVRGEQLLKDRIQALFPRSAA